LSKELNLVYQRRHEAEKTSSVHRKDRISEKDAFLRISPKHISDESSFRRFTNTRKIADAIQSESVLTEKSSMNHINFVIDDVS
jgi:hypothetical protein